MKRIARVVGILTFWMLMSCQFFELREPQPPTNGMGWVEPNCPENVLRNMEYAYHYYTLDNYMLCFDSTRFRFYADESLLNGPHGYLYENWDYQKEYQQTQQLFSSYLSLSPDEHPLLMISIDSLDEFGDTARISAHYRLMVTLRDSRQLTAFGNSKFYLHRHEDGFWYIFEWWDEKTTPSTLSWAEIKALDF